MAQSWRVHTISSPRGLGVIHNFRSRIAHCATRVFNINALSGLGAPSNVGSLIGTVHVMRS